MTRIRLIVGLIIPHRTYLTITKTRKGRPRLGVGCSTTDDERLYIMQHRSKVVLFVFHGYEYNIKMHFKEIGFMWSGPIWLRIGPSSGFL
jgi:hypothetical protein